MGERSEAVSLTLESIEEFIRAQKEKGLKKNTVTSYRTNLFRIYRRLPEGKKQLEAGTIRQLTTALKEQGLSEQSLNSFLMVSNLFLDYYGRRDFQDTKYYPRPPTETLPLTRSEYQRLLLAARQKNEEREYLMVKSFAVIGLKQNELSQVTAEAVEAGIVTVEQGQIHIPQSFRKELLDYMKKQKIISGPLFINKSGTPYQRQTISKFLSALCDEAHVERSRGTSRNLRMLCDNTMTDLRNNLEQLIQQAYDRIIDMEQLTVAWDMSDRQKDVRQHGDYAISAQPNSL